MATQVASSIADLEDSRNKASDLRKIKNPSLWKVLDIFNTMEPVETLYRRCEIHTQTKIVAIRTSLMLRETVKQCSSRSRCLYRLCLLLLLPNLKPYVAALDAQGVDPFSPNGRTHLQLLTLSELVNIRKLSSDRRTSSSTVAGINAHDLGLPLKSRAHDTEFKEHMTSNDFRTKCCKYD